MRFLMANPVILWCCCCRSAWRPLTGALAPAVAVLEFRHACARSGLMVMLVAALAAALGGRSAKAVVAVAWLSQSRSPFASESQRCGVWVLGDTLECTCAANRVYSSSSNPHMLMLFNPSSAGRANQVACLMSSNAPALMLGLLARATTLA
jgi:hypothetical protein